LSVELAEALAAARAELQRLEAREAEQLERSGLRDTVNLLTVENQRLSEEREQMREELQRLERQLREERERKAMLELQLKGARSRVQKLTQAVRGPR
jgi:hypothetical protein